MGVSERNNPTPGGGETNALEKLKTALSENMDQIARDPRALLGGLATQAANRAAAFVADAAKDTAEKLAAVSEQAAQALSAKANGGEDDSEPEDNPLSDNPIDGTDAFLESSENGEEEEAALLLPDDGAALEAAESESAAAQEPEELKTENTPPKQDTSGDAPSGAQKKKFSVFGVITAALLAVIALVSVGGVVIALMDFNLFRGIESSAFVGVENFMRFLNGANFAPTLRNSAFLRLIQIGAGLILALPLMAWIKMGKHPGKTLTKAFLCLAPYCLPYIVSAYAVISALPREMIMDKNGGYLMYGLATVLQTAGFIGFCGGFFSYLNMRGIGKGARQGVLLALLVSLLLALTPDQGAVMMITNGVNRGATMTLDYYAYTTAFMQNKLGISSAVSVVKAAGQGVIGALAAALICKIAKKDESRIELPDAQASVFTFTASKLIWTGILLALVIFSFGIDVAARQPEASAQALASAAQNAAQDAVTHSTALISAVVAVLGGVTGGLAAYSFIVFFRSGRKGLGVAVWIAASSLTFLASQYYLVRQLGLLNTVFPMILRQIVDPRLISLMIVLAVALRMAPERRTKGILLGLIFFAMAFAWGDFFGSNLYAAGGNTTLAGYLYHMVMQGTGRVGAGAPAELLGQQAAVPVLSLLVSVPALTLGFLGAACCIRGFKDAR